MLEKENTEMSLRHPCRIVNIPRSGLYYISKKDVQKDLEWMLLIDKIFLEQPTLGSRGIQINYGVNTKSLSIGSEYRG